MNKNKEAKNMYNTSREKPGKKKTKLIGGAESRMDQYLWKNTS
jgi:hypothetical protein